MRSWRLLFFCLCIFVSAVSPLRAAPRDDTRLESGWRFKQADVTGAEQSGFDDSDWQSISLPHNWGWQEAMNGQPYYRGPGWYRRDLNLGAPQTGRRYFLRFEAASTVADVYLNGNFIGQHRGGFGAFCFEITSQLATNGTNLLAIRVSNAPQPDIAPISGDFSVYGGLYRPVHLLITDNVCFTPTDHASPGVAWLQTKVSPEEVDLDITAQISNGTRSNLPFTVVASVFDATGNLAGSTEQNIRPAPGRTAPYFLHVTIPNPHLWNGRKDPYLYKAVIELRDTSNVVDSVTQPLGLRFYSVDPDKGFFLNGQPYHLHGVNKHQDREGKGWAVSEADLDEDVALIKELGCTVVRCAHYQHSDYFYSLCDQAGILVWAEIPQVNEIHGTPEFEETSRNQLVDLIRQNVNHPSIFAWSLFNELWPAATNADPHRELQDLKITANGEDPTRPTICATSNNGMPQMNRIPDLLGWNIYPGWYSSWGAKDSFGKLLDQRRNDSRHGGFCVSEYGAGANVLQHEQDPKPPVPTSQWHPEEWQAIVHEEAWKQMKARPYVWGTFAWAMFDFAVASRHEGGVPGRNDKGLVTYDRKTKKDAFFFYKANWSDDPVLYITSRRFTGRTNAFIDVKVYSNAAEVEVLVNGATLGTCKNDGNDVFVWNKAGLKPGDNRIEARARRNDQDLTDTCVWTLK
jgi:beta-galactosidase